MRKKIYDSKNQVFDDIKRIKKENLPCIESVIDDIFDIPLTSPFYSFGPQPMGYITVKFSFDDIKPMSWIGDWFIQYSFNVEVLESKYSNDNLEKPWEDIFERLFKDRDIQQNNTSFGYFLTPIIDELSFLCQLCNLTGDVSIKKIRWKNKN